MFGEWKAENKERERKKEDQEGKGNTEGRRGDWSYHQSSRRLWVSSSCIIIIF